MGNYLFENDYKQKFKHNFSEPVVIWNTGNLNTLPIHGEFVALLATGSTVSTGLAIVTNDLLGPTGSVITTNVITSTSFSTIEEVISGTNSIVTLQQVTTNGATTSNFATFSGGVNLSYNTVNFVNVGSDISIGVNTIDGTSNIISNGGNIELSILTNGMFPDVGYIDITPYTFSINTNSYGTAKIDTNNLSTDRTFTFPNESGMFSLTNDVYATQTTGITISFNKPKVYNLPASPATASIANDLTGAKIGVVQKLYHQYGATPTFPGGWVKVGGTYSTSQLNIIYSEYVTGTRVEYWIINI